MPAVKKKVSIMLPLVMSPKTPSKESHDRTRTHSTRSLKSLLSISEISDVTDFSNRLEQRKLRYSTLLGLPPGFTLGNDPYNMINQSDWHDNRFRRESKSIYKTGRLKMHDAVPILSFRVAVICLILNIMLPGLGKFHFLSLFCFCVSGSEPILILLVLLN